MKVKKSLIKLHLIQANLEAIKAATRHTLSELESLSGELDEETKLHLRAPYISIELQLDKAIEVLDYNIREIKTLL